MKSYLKPFITLTIILSPFASQAANVLDSDWDDVARGRCSDQTSDWWKSDEAIRIAQNVLLYQKDNGGWQKNTDFHLVLTVSQKSSIEASKSDTKGVTTIDNGAVSYELQYLSRVYAAISDTTVKNDIKNGFLNGVQYLLDAQYDNGGWPQFYPIRGGYWDHITYNDDAMVHVLNILRSIYTKDGTYSVEVEDALIQEAKTAYEKGIECILKTQYVQNNKLTVWCAQHHYNTMEPVKARSYELASLSGQESARILTFLMSIDNPSKDIRRAIYSGIQWYEDVTIEGKRIEKFTNNNGDGDIRIVADPNASDLWARFYKLEDNRPFFCDRDGIMKFSLAEIGHERRNGYSWYNTSGKEVSGAAPTWLSKWGTTVLASPLPGQEILSSEGVNVMAFANKNTGSTLSKFEMILDEGSPTEFNSTLLETELADIDTGMHTIIVNAVYANGTTEADTVTFRVYPASFTLTVNRGDGDGEYYQNTIVSIRANAPASGNVFERWVGDTAYIENIYDIETSVTIPNTNIRLTAIYETDPAGIQNSKFNLSENICYPNPVKHNLTVDLTEIGKSTIEIFDLQSRKVYAQEKSQGIHQIDVSFLNKGQYIINITSMDNTQYRKKVLVY